MKAKLMAVGLVAVAGCAALALSCKGNGETRSESAPVTAVATNVQTAPETKPEDRPYALTGAGAEALRAAFNADAGKVRLVVLVAPT